MGFSLVIYQRADGCCWLWSGMSDYPNRVSDQGVCCSYDVRVARKVRIRYRSFGFLSYFVEE